MFLISTQFDREIGEKAIMDLTSAKFACTLGDRCGTVGDIEALMGGGENREYGL